MEGRMAEEGSGAAGAENAGGSEGGKAGEGEQGSTQQQGGQGEGSSNKTAEEYRQELRTYERNAKKASERKDAELLELKGKLEQHEAATQTETEKAIAKAKKEARSEAESEFDKERRTVRLDVAVSKHARDLADVDDVISNLQREGTDSFFDKEGKVDADALKSALEDLLGRKPHLKAGPHGRPSGSANGGEGEGGGGETMNDLLRAGR